MKEILIKKYDNRRLYCVEEAKYVSLTEIRDFLQRGDRVKVIEKSSGKDITKYVLMQVLLEDRYELLPTYFYQMVLQSPRENVEGFFRQFFPWMMDAYKKYQESGFQPPVNFSNPWGQNPFQLQNPFFSAMESPAKKAAKKQAAATQPDSEPPQPSAEPEDKKMAEILKRLKELEEKLQSDS